MKVLENRKFKIVISGKNLKGKYLEFLIQREDSHWPRVKKMKLSNQNPPLHGGRIRDKLWAMVKNTLKNSPRACSDTSRNRQPRSKILSYSIRP